MGQVIHLKFGRSSVKYERNPQQTTPTKVNRPVMTVEMARMQLERLQARKEFLDTGPYPLADRVRLNGLIKDAKWELKLALGVAMPPFGPNSA